jgi:hypothetical protein
MNIKLLSVFVIAGFLLSISSWAELRVGASSTTINPKKGVFLGGYGKNRKCTGVHDNLYAKAVVFDDGHLPVALVILDSVGTHYDTIQQIRQLASQSVKNISIPPERVIVSSTHTHCSPDNIGVYGPNQVTSGRDPEYIQSMVKKAAKQVALAAQNLESTTLVWAKAPGGEWAVNDSEPEDIVRDLTIIQCLNRKGKSIATLTNFACHPTVLDGNTTEASSDWVGSFYANMAKALPGEHIFLQGGIGGWIQPKTPERTFTLAERYGNDLAHRALEALKSSKKLLGTDIRFANKVFMMPNQNEGFKQLSQAGVIPRPISEGIETEVAWFAIGSAQFATHPGETAPTFTWATEALMDSEPKLVLGLGLDELGYILKPTYFVDPKAIPHAEYLTMMSPGPKAGASMMAALEAIIP